VALFAADPTSPRLGYLNCEKEQITCSIWSASPAAVWHFQVPDAALAGQSRPTTPLHIVDLNITTVTSDTIYKIHSQKAYEKFSVYEGIFHPLDGVLAQYGLNVPLGYILFGFGIVPSWLFMVGISFLSRTLM
jgi:hypothetical protein